MISYPLAIALAGLLLWLIFTKWRKVADAWVAEFGRLCFFAGLLAWLFSVQAKSLF
jgi:hypothetical protein